jgi:hypothetical protein
MRLTPNRGAFNNYCGCVVGGGVPGGTFGLIFGVFGGRGFVDGADGNSGTWGVDGDVGGGGEYCVQPAVMAVKATAARVDLGIFRSPS